jgi:hypothetical protein
MSEENVETVRAVMAAINRGDLEAAVAYLSADFIPDWSASLAPEAVSTEAATRYGKPSLRAH